MSFKMSFGRCGLAALAVAGATVALPAIAADHRDGTAAVADPTSDINDVYSWMSADDNLVVAMTVHPFADADAVFSPEVQFAWHVDAHGSVATAVTGTPASISTTVQCEFDEAQMIQCWVHRDGEVLDYVLGDAGLEEGLLSNSGETRVFAGLRADPFFFYLTGFSGARAAVISEVEAGNVSFPNSTFCPELTDGQLTLLGDTLGAEAEEDNDFLGQNTLAIVLELDKTLFTDDEASVVSVHATTHAKP